jgi:ATP-dependent DNA helicase RecG
MATTPAQIDLWMQSRSEHQRLEFKEAKKQYDNTKLFKYCVALANEGGGTLLLGVTDKPPRRVVGSAACNDPVGMAEVVFTNIGFRVDIEEVAHPDGRVVVFHIPPRPRGTAYHLGGAYRMRSGEELVPMSEDRLRTIFAEGQPDWLEEPARAELTPQQVIELPCYQHCVLRWVMREPMTNQSLRQRFRLPDSKSAIASQIIAATVEASWIKPDEEAGTSKKLARYLPFWA